MSVENVQIVFDDPTAVFTPGQTITGRVLIGISKSSVKVKYIKLKFRGEANVRWYEMRSKTRTLPASSHYFTSKEEYFKNVKNNFFLVGAKGESQLEVGDYVYPFNFSLPHEIPSTFKGQHGEVFYIAKVKINIPWRISIEKKTIFEVISPVHLNEEPSLAEPKTALKEKFYCCFLCKSGPMTLIAYIPYSGFIPGQSIPVTVELDNNSNVYVNSIEIKLERTLEYTARYPTGNKNYEHSNIVNVFIDGVEKYNSKTCVEQLQIPNEITVVAHVNIQHLKEVASIKIKLGTTPLTIDSNDSEFD
ncbi:arrestin domain-containing protein 3-like [Acyrthosiphon pisum]|uniref:Arrestin C-terminal-like domain-containing protein n=1 Tax=Acyrthosiphon pisum TaxID=7029 RepID=A0A8R1WBI4_ACYPI|nr:arrestin domain-containing protein 3-like [Acyrthosiphon pisum]|eukprot:XP_003245917.1 PREDICTED: arrestin domain-containing protein 3-like [Acyrthosiphon pisum]